jgi:hypothetical protein
MDATGSACQRYVGHTVARNRLQVDAWVAGGWCSDEMVECDAVCSGQGEQQLECRTAGPGL